MTRNQIPLPLIYRHIFEIRGERKAQTLAISPGSRDQQRNSHNVKGKQ
jgi:hypothetical protein